MVRAAVVSGVVLLGLVAGSAAASGAERHISIETLSTGPDHVTGGDVLLRVGVPDHVSLSVVRVALNGADVTGSLVPDPSAHALVGVLTGLVDGDNVVTASASRTTPSLQSRKVIRNFPLHGPVFSGPHQRPWVCETIASGLGPPPASGPCVAPTRHEWFYRSASGTFKGLPSLAPPYPADLVDTVTVDGISVPYIVRVESGTINESIYRIAILDDPTNPIANPWSAGGKRPGPGWNGKLSFPFGGGCGPAFRSGRNAVTSALANDPLGLGFAVAFGTRNTLGNGCNFAVSAETMMMIKEHFSEQYGVPRFTIGSGGSGGSMQQHYIAQNYPGLLDAITPGISYADLVSILPDVTDCGLLNNYFANVADPASWPPERRAKVDGYPAGTSLGGVVGTTCRSWDRFAHVWVTPAGFFDAAVPIEDQYDPDTNPGGARGTFTDGMVNVFGIDPRTGFARTVYDNVGVQYGLEALNGGSITPAEFIDLNERIGGIDVDGNYVATRSEASLKGLEIAYRDGVVDSGENLTLPMIDTRVYLDDLIDIHTRIRTFAKLDRLRRQNGTTENEVNWLWARLPAPGFTLPNTTRMALLAHNRWLENLQADASDLPYADKVIRSKPDVVTDPLGGAFRVTDTCWDDRGVAHEEPFTLDPSGVCNSIFPIYSTVRIAAGGPVAGDILKCHLKPVDWGDYAVTLTPAERARLRALFPGGVCDWSRPGVKQRPMHRVWPDYTPR